MTLTADGPTGSSPRARGARPGAHGRGRGRGRGIIPACAGSTCRRACPCAATRDHPRVRGEHKRLIRHDPPGHGSSPRARGAPAQADALGEGRGIIPACAGSTVAVSGAGPEPADHPRVRGEHCRMNRPSRSITGSSPRARGALYDRRPGFGVSGIIPACAGSTTRGFPPTTVRRDHPRVRGEHGPRLLRHQECRGSSPRARGAHRHRRARRLPPGIIPACAGSTPAPQASADGCRDHPRVRGEHSQSQPVPWDRQGSSPRARGAHGAFRS